MTPRARSFNLADLFEIVAQSVPDRIAFRCGDTQLSYRELDQRATRLADALRTQGVRRGDNVGIQLHNSAAYLESFFACCKIGAAPVNVNYRYVADELTYLFRTLDLKALVYGEAFDTEVRRAQAESPLLRLLLRVGDAHTAPAGTIDYARALSDGSPALDDPERSDQDIFMLCTGGTTGMPKGVMWPHKSIFMAALGGGGMYFRRPPIQHPEELLEFVPQGPALVYFAAAPLMHGAAMWASLISLFSGHTVVVNDRLSFEAEHVWDLVERTGVNVISIVGDAMAQPLVRALEQHPGRWDLSRLFTFGNGGAVFSRQLQDRLKAQLPHLMISNALGTSESGTLGGVDRADHAGGFMAFEPRSDLAVVDDSLRVVSAHGAGGILARTGYTPIGYYGDPTKSAETFVQIDGRLWVLTGDRARIDEHGHYVVVGRGSQCINSGGEKVYPEEVEEAARHCTWVEDVLVVGVPDERWGQRVVAVVQATTTESFDAAELERVCRRTLAGYKVPRAVVRVEQIRRSPAGKADYTWARGVAVAAASKSN